MSKTGGINVDNDSFGNILSLGYLASLDIQVNMSIGHLNSHKDCRGGRIRTS